MSKTCNACGGTVCEVCGGCIAHGECSCMENQIRSLLERSKESEAKLLKISEILSERHGDDGRFEGPEDEYNDDPEVITIKRIFAIIEGDVTPDEVHGPGGYKD